jgi:hypothetical protein
MIFVRRFLQNFLVLCAIRLWCDRLLNTYETGQPVPMFTVSKVCNEGGVAYNRQWSGNGVPKSGY